MSNPLDRAIQQNPPETGIPSVAPKAKAKTKRNGGAPPETNAKPDVEVDWSAVEHNIAAGLNQPKPPNGDGDADPAPEVEARPRDSKPPSLGAAAAPIDAKSGSGPNGETTTEDLDEDAAEFARLRRDLPNVSGAAALGITAISVVKAPPRNEFFRAWKGFRPIVDLVVDQVKLDQRYYAVDPVMAPVLASIGIAYAPHVLFFIMTTKGAFRTIPVRCADGDGDRNGYASSKELALRESEDGWVRIYTDLENACYRKFPAPIDRFPEPVWPELSAPKIFRLCFRDRGFLIDTPQHPRFVDWVGRKPKDDGQ